MGFISKAWDSMFGGDSIFGKAWSSIGMTEAWENNVSDPIMDAITGYNDADGKSSNTETKNNDNQCLGTCSANTETKNNDNSDSKKTNNAGKTVGGTANNVYSTSNRKNKVGTLVGAGSNTFGFTEMNGSGSTPTLGG